MRYVYLIFFLQISGSIFGQIAGSVMVLPSDLQLAQDQKHPTILQYEVSYWTRLKNKRLEFYPSIIWQSDDHQLSATDMGSTGIFGFRTWIVAYPFDFGSDCNCPTFSKQNELLKKGFFVQLGPEYLFAENGFASLNAGIGLDIGLTNLLTLSPTLSYRKSFNTTENSAWLMPGLRLGIRLDKRNY